MEDELVSVSTVVTDLLVDILPPRDKLVIISKKLLPNLCPEKNFPNSLPLLLGLLEGSGFLYLSTPFLGRRVCGGEDGGDVGCLLLLELECSEFLLCRDRELLPVYPGLVLCKNDSIGHYF